MTEWFTGNFSEINWNAMHIIFLESDGILEWKELYARKWEGRRTYDIKFKHAFESSNNMQKLAYIYSEGNVRSGNDAKLEVCEGLYHGLLNGDTERYERIAAELFETHPSIKKIFFEVVFA